MKRLLADLREPVLLVTSIGEQLQSIGIALAVGAGAGLVVGWLVR